MVNHFTQSLATSPRVYEEDLLLAMRRAGLRRVTTTTTTTTSTTTTTTTTEAPSTNSKKGSVCVNDHGKNYIKQRSESFDSCCDKGNDNSNPMDTQKFIHSLCLQ